MQSKDARIWNWLEQMSPTLFIIAGLFIAANVVVLGFEAFTEATLLDLPLLPLGFLIGILGLMGLYPTLSKGTSNLLKTGAFIGLIPITAWTFFTVTGILDVLGIWAAPENTPMPIVILVTISVIITYALFSVASFRSEQTSTVLSWLLLMPSLLFVLLILGSMTGVASEAGPFIIDLGHTLSHLAIGFTLMSGSESIRSTRQVAESMS